jgi:hypothetical protein
MASQYCIAGALLIAVSSGPINAQPPTPPPFAADAAAPATVALVETWPDGLTNYELTSPRRAAMWTPGFPRVAGYKAPDGVASVFAVQFVRVLVGHDIKVDVSGRSAPLGNQACRSPASRSRPVPGRHRRLAVRVQPVTLSMARVAPMTPHCRPW